MFDVVLFEGGYFPDSDRFEGEFRGRDYNTCVISPTLGGLLGKILTTYRTDVEGIVQAGESPSYQVLRNGVIFVEVGVHFLDGAQVFSAFVGDIGDWETLVSHESLEGLMQVVANEVNTKDCKLFLVQ